MLGQWDQSVCNHGRYRNVWTAAVYARYRPKVYVPPKAPTHLTMPAFGEPQMEPLVYLHETILEKSNSEPSNYKRKHPEASHRN